MDADMGVMPLRHWLASVLRRVVRWLDREPVVLLIVTQDALLERARVLVAAAEGTFESGEARRHQVYARLIKEFPERSKRVIAKAIEAAL